MKRLLIFFAALIAPTLCFSWETATPAEISTYLSANYTWWGNIKDGSAHNTYVERSVDTVKTNADGSLSAQTRDNHGLI